jgi:Glycosyl transferase family 2
MAISNSPLVSIGLPVYNGERFVSCAIESVLQQTFTDFELIISDNASTDRTAEICLAYAAKDSRVRYQRLEINIGAKANFNRVFELARGKYFKWVAADDVCGPKYLELTVDVLEKDPSVILAHTRTEVIDGKGAVLKHEELARGIVFDEGLPVSVRPPDRPRKLAAPLAHQRFHEVLLGTRWCFETFALIRRQAMVATYPHMPFYGSDKVMLAQLSLMGKFHEVLDTQFFRRAHHGNSTNMTVVARETWSRPQKASWQLPTQFPCLAGYTRAAIWLPSSLGDRLRCLGVVMIFILRPLRYRKLASELFMLARCRFGYGQKRTRPEAAQPHPLSGRLEAGRPVTGLPGKE